MALKYMLREQEKRENLPDRVGVLFVCVHGSATNKATKSIITALQTKIEKENLLVTWVVSFDHDKKGFMNALAVEEHLHYSGSIASIYTIYGIIA